MLQALKIELLITGFSNCSHSKTNWHRDMKPASNGQKYPKFSEDKKISHSSNSVWDIQSERDGPLTSSLKIQWNVHTYLLARPCIYVLILNLNKQFFETLQALVCGPNSSLGTSYDLLFDMMACIAYVLKHLIVCSHTLLTLLIIIT